MLTTVPIYDTAATIADTTIAAIKAAFPTLEAQLTNPGPYEALRVEVRNPLNGDCWTPTLYLAPHDRYADKLEIAVGTASHAPAAQFSCNPTKKQYVDPAVIAKTVVEYITMERARQERQILADRAEKASRETAKRLNQELLVAGLPTATITTPYLYFGVNKTGSGNYIYSDVPRDVTAVTLHFANAIVTPEIAQRIFELWLPIGKLLVETPSLRDDEKSSCAGTLIN